MSDSETPKHPTTTRSSRRLQGHEPENTGLPTDNRATGCKDTDNRATENETTEKLPVEATNNTDKLPVEKIEDKHTAKNPADPNQNINEYAELHRFTAQHAKLYAARRALRYWFTKQHLFCRDPHSDPTGEFENDEMTAFCRDQMWGWNGIDPETLWYLGQYIVYSWPLLCEEYAGIGPTVC